MDSLLQAAIRRRELETELLLRNGDPQARGRHCLECGRLMNMREDATIYVCAGCVPNHMSRTKRAKEDTKVVHQARRERLEEVALVATAILREKN